jgi:hypothetical protein
LAATNRGTVITADEVGVSAGVFLGLADIVNEYPIRLFHLTRVRRRVGSRPLFGQV